MGPAAWPPDGSQLPGFLGPTLIAAATVLAFVLFEAAERFNRRDERLPTGLCLAASTAASALAIGLGWGWLQELGIDPTRHGYGAVVWTLLGYMGLHVAIGAGMALWCLARVHLGMIDSWCCLTLRICLLWWRLTGPVTVLVLVAGFPHIVS